MKEAVEEVLADIDSFPIEESIKKKYKDMAIDGALKLGKISRDDAREFRGNSVEEDNAGMGDGIPDISGGGIA